MNFTFLLTAATILVVRWSHFCSSQVTCNGFISGIINSGVVCGDGDCILDDATISGSVECSSGTLLAIGDSFISGNILLSGGVTRAELDAVTVLGTVDVIEAGSLVELVIKQAATLGSVKIENTAVDVVVAGSLNDLQLIDAGSLFVNGLSTVGGVLVSGGNGIIQLCGSFLDSLLVREHEGDVDINANSGNCTPTTLIGGMNVNKGSGRVTVIGANLSGGDFIVSEYIGGVVLEVAQVSDIKLEKHGGFLTVLDVLADSDMIITEQEGNVVIENLNSTGDVILEKIKGSLTLRDVINSDMVITAQEGNVALSNLNTTGDVDIKEVVGEVTLGESNFADESVSIALVSGTVTVQNNTRLSLNVEEISGMVQIIDNIIFMAA